MEMSEEFASGDGIRDSRSAIPRKQLVAAMVGNVLEFYDFIVFAFLAATIGHKFFGGGEVTELLASFATFGVGFLARPVGGLIIGRIADKAGRKIALQLTIFGMGLGTVGIGVLPTYDDIGIAAPLLLVCMRLMQGLAAGGEFGTSMSLVVESAPPTKRGFYGALGQASSASSYLVSSLVVAGITASFSAGQIDAWAWRVPFLLGGLLLIVGAYLRRNLHETKKFEQAKAQERPSQAVSNAAYVKMCVRALTFPVVWTVSSYVMLSYMPTFLTTQVGLTRLEALLSNSVGLVLLVVATPIAGALSDRYGRKPFLISCCLVFAVLSYPLFSVLLQQRTVGYAIGVQAFLDLFIAIFSGAAPAALCELFPTRSRTTMLSCGYGIATAMFGGFAPFISTALIRITGSSVAPTFYLILSAVISGVAIVMSRETAHEDLG